MGRFVKAFNVQSSISGILLPSGPSSLRPAMLVNGTVRYNNDINNFEYYDGTEWRVLGNDDPMVSKLDWIADGSSAQFHGVHQSATVVNTDVYVEGVWQELDYACAIVGPAEDRAISFASPPPAGMRIIAITRSNA